MSLFDFFDSISAKCDRDTKRRESPELISYNFLRRALGILGLAFPVILWLGGIILGEGLAPQKSISMYYDTVMRNVFVGFLFTIGIFFFSYRGYGRADNWFGFAACLFALLTAFCPTTSYIKLVHCIHLISAGIFILILAIFSFCLFTIKKSDAKPEKLARNKIHYICGIIIFFSLVMLILYIAIPGLEESDLSRFKPIFFLETLALWAFGISWLTKGGFIFPDEDEKRPCKYRIKYPKQKHNNNTGHKVTSK